MLDNNQMNSFAVHPLTYSKDWTHFNEEQNLFSSFSVFGDSELNTERKKKYVYACAYIIC